MSTRHRRAIAVAALAIGLAPAAGALAQESNVIYNPSFGQGLRGWRTMVLARGTVPGNPHILALRTPQEPLLKCERAQRGHPYLQMDVPGDASGYVEQEIIVPVAPGRLSFRAWGDLEAVKATVDIVVGPFVHRLASFVPPTLQAAPGTCSGRKAITESLNVSRYAGEAVGVRIQATSPGSSGSIVDFDDFALR